MSATFYSNKKTKILYDSLSVAKLHDAQNLEPPKYMYTQRKGRNIRSIEKSDSISALVLINDMHGE